VSDVNLRRPISFPLRGIASTAVLLQTVGVNSKASNTDGDFRKLIIPTLE
jgi:hypothetical protein